MKRIRIFLPLAVFICSVMAAGQSTKSSVDGSESLTEQPQQSAAPRPAASRSEEMLERWNDIGNKLIAMAQDFPEDKYDYKLQKDERTFALNLLHAAARISSSSGEFLERTSGRTSVKATILRATNSRPRPTW